jgi:hypothetical protein
MTRPLMVSESACVEPVQSRAAIASDILAVLIVVMGVLTAGVTIWLVVRSYSPAIYWDQWQVIDLLMRAQGHPTLRNLWEQHNEHRILIGRLFCFADVIFFGGKSVSLLVQIMLVQALHLALLLFLVRRYLEVGRSVSLSLAGLFAYCMFSPIQMENFVWGFQIGFVIAALASSATFALAVLHSGARERTIGPKLLFAAALCCAFVSEASLANGLLVWPFLFLLAVSLRFPRIEKWIVVLTGSVAIAAYMVGYRSPGYLSNPLSSLKHPLAVLKYVITYLAFSWDSNVPNPSNWPTVSESLTLLAMLIVIIGGIRRLRHGAWQAPFETFLLINMLFVLATATVTALGRITLGYSQATSGRYQTYALIFWACFAAWAATKLKSPNMSRLSLLTAQTFALLLLLAMPARFDSIQAQAFDRQTRWNRGMQAVLHHAYSDPAIGLIYHHPQMIPAYMNFLAQHHWGPLQAFEVSTAREKPPVSGYQMAPQSRCVGYLDTAIELPRTTDLTVTGWAWDNKTQTPPPRVAIASSAGAVVAVGPTSSPRSDVSAILPRTAAAKTGWSVALHSPSNDHYKAFAIVDNGKSACPLQNSLTIRQ